MLTQSMKSSFCVGVSALLALCHDKSSCPNSMPRLRIHSASICREHSDKVTSGSWFTCRIQSCDPDILSRSPPKWPGLIYWLDDLCTPNSVDRENVSPAPVSTNNMSSCQLKKDQENIFLLVFNSFPLTL